MRGVRVGTASVPRQINAAGDASDVNPAWWGDVTSHGPQYLLTFTSPQTSRRIHGDAMSVKQPQ